MERIKTTISMSYSKNIREKSISNYKNIYIYIYIYFNCKIYVLFFSTPFLSALLLFVIKVVSNLYEYEFRSSITACRHSPGSDLGEPSDRLHLQLEIPILHLSFFTCYSYWHVAPPLPHFSDVSFFLKATNLF